MGTRDSFHWHGKFCCPKKYTQFQIFILQLSIKLSEVTCQCLAAVDVASGCVSPPGGAAFSLLDGLVFTLSEKLNKLLNKYRSMYFTLYLQNSVYSITL